MSVLPRRLWNFLQRSKTSYSRLVYVRFRNLQMSYFYLKIEGLGIEKKMFYRDKQFMSFNQINNFLVCFFYNLVIVHGGIFLIFTYAR